MTIDMAEDGAVTGELTMENPMDQSEMNVSLSGAVNAKTLELTGSFEMGDFAVDFEYELTLDGDELAIRESVPQELSVN